MPHHCFWQIFSVCLLFALYLPQDLGGGRGWPGNGVHKAVHGTCRQAMDKGRGSWVGGYSWGQSFVSTCYSLSCDTALSDWESQGLSTVDKHKCIVLANSRRSKKIVWTEKREF